MSAWYNEIEPFAASWMEQLIAGGHIAHGRVERRSIADLEPADIGEGQAHFFAGIGGWSYALRLAGVPDDAPVWTGSCPCQPFSAAGKGRGVADERHLWPEWFRLIRERRPRLIFGEQVASPLGLAWFDAVSADLEGAGYAVGAADLCAAGVGAPHIRQRLYFVAYAQCGAAERWRFDVGGAARGIEGGAQERERLRDDAGAGIEPSPVAHDNEGGREELAAARIHVPRQPGHDADGRGESDQLADAAGERHDRGRPGEEGGGQASQSERLRDAVIVEHAERARLEGHAGYEREGHEPRRNGAHQARSVAAPGWAGGMADANGGIASDGELQRGGEHRQQPQDRIASPWSRAEWLPCRDGKARLVEPGVFPLAHGVPARVGRLRGYGNAIVPQVAAAFVTAALDAIA